MRAFLGIVSFIFFVNLTDAANDIDSHGVILVYHHVSTDTPPQPAYLPKILRSIYTT